MNRKSMIKMALAVLGLVLIFNLGTFAQKDDCADMTDDQIVTAIYDQIKVKYEDQADQINVRIKDGVVTLEGWVTNKKIRKEIEKYAKKTKCVTKVVNKLTIGVGGGCSPGQKPCGSICIPMAEKCNIRG